MTRHRPDKDTFVELAREHTIVPVWREVLTDTQTPVAAFLRLDPQPNAFLLESVEGGERWARYSFLGGDAFATVSAKDGEIFVSGDPPVVPNEGERPLAYVKRLVETCRAPRIEGLPPLHGGAVGFLGYDCVRELERLPSPPPDDLGLPDLALILTRDFVVFDHLLQKAFVITNVTRPDDPARAYEEATARCDAISTRLAEPLEQSTFELDWNRSPDATQEVEDDEYALWVDTCREHIYAGDIFQVVPSRRFEAPLEGSAFDAYRALRAVNPSPYMYYLRFAAADGRPDFEVAGSSPEPLVRVTGDHIVTRPIAGTRRRGASEDEDRALADELLADEKERAEHVMLVDLARNDVGRVARYGTVKVEELMVIEKYSHVMHIVSSVTGTLDPDKTAFDALAACFPAGTVSGAPKVRAMEIIDELEKTRRGPYAGVVGYFDFSGDLDTCIVIRTVVVAGGRAYVQAGAGIVADSRGPEEADETRRKAEAVLRAVGAVRGKAG
ncbi:MAG: anthranilate synthase component I [Actinomycetota bacterium]|nr:anthranilate synthase component I [Actinomycetota bacterium]